VLFIFVKNKMKLIFFIFLLICLFFFILKFDDFVLKYKVKKTRICFKFDAKLLYSRCNFGVPIFTRLQFWDWIINLKKVAFAFFSFGIGKNWLMKKVSFTFFSFGIGKIWLIKKVAFTFFDHGFHFFWSWFSLFLIMDLERLIDKKSDPEERNYCSNIWCFFWFLIIFCCQNWFFFVIDTHLFENWIGKQTKNSSVSTKKNEKNQKNSFAMMTILRKWPIWRVMHDKEHMNWQKTKKKWDLQW